MEMLYNTDKLNQLFSSDVLRTIWTAKEHDMLPSITKWASIDEAHHDASSYYSAASVLVTNMLNSRKAELNDGIKKDHLDVRPYMDVIADNPKTIIKINDNSYNKATIHMARLYFELFKVHPGFEGLSSEHALGMLANMIAESGLDGTIIEGNSAQRWSLAQQKAAPKIALGVAQFTRSSGVVFLENVHYSWKKNNGNASLSLQDYSGAIFNPVYQIDHLMRMLLDKNHVQHKWNDGFIYSQLKGAGFFKKVITGREATGLFLKKYERPKNQVAEEVKRYSIYLDLKKYL